ncbi:hypothetical protein FNO01nite_15490 [Flavobacterium noncentrifugens]|uniref:Uncharacterized conserved protein, DUF1015 family n=1 Tax=Flavobacterium noncentrifugens TaxID=1128970 RepID=A0A1G8WDS6_9FLAO|nr:DUF1015 domain-containing protein [Flavobacterium noncentrifugens]GEP50877.1 hypothetical protein FNO01nite_15490 [Flavobacterium noncentrifugens]SDJ76266.1 Uncharacterized conserved protein, DUF1015 family [Flavobacterium noncentrifugens]
MAQIIPFKAVLPSRDKVSLVTSRSYDEYSAAELAAQLDFNPFSFLHVLNPAYVNQQKIGLEKRFKLVAQKYKDFKNEEVLANEENPVLFLYEIQSKNQVFNGIIGATSIADYQNNVIKKHEDTLQYRVEIFKDYLHQTRFNTEPVLITYPDDADLESWIQKKKGTDSLYEFSTKKKEKHTLWKISDADEIHWLQQKFEKIGDVYIADGHHRSASAELLYEQDKTSGNKNLDYFMSFLIAESNVKIYEYNRIIRDLNGHSKEGFIQELSKLFWIKNKEQELWKPLKKFQFGMYLDGEFYSLELKDTNDFKTVLDSLDAQILYEKVLLPILGISDLRNDERIDYIPGNQSITTIKEVIDEGEFEIGFMLFPTEISEIKALADNDLIMPPKSTYIEPKFRSGLVVYEI